MKVGELKAVLAGADDDDEVLVPSFDHSYTKVSSVSLSKVNRGKGEQRGEWWEYWSEEDQLPETESDVVVAVVIQ